MSGFYICHLCELRGLPAGERFTAPADVVGRALMEEHVLEPHPALQVTGVAFVGPPAGLDLPLDCGDGGN